MQLCLTPVLIIALVAGCGGGITTVSLLPATVTLKLGGDVQVTSPDIRLRLVEFVQDSRCPVDVVCIQEVSVTLRFSVSVAGGPESGLILQTGETDSSLGVVLRIREITPDRRVNVPLIDPRDYRVSLEISPAGS